MTLETVLNQAKNQQDFSSEAARLLFSPEFDPFRDRLFASADQVRHDMVGDDVYLRGLIEFSNYCSCRCTYCGISAENPNIARYRMSRDEILRTIKSAVDLGYQSFVLQSGEDPFFKVDEICRLIDDIKSGFSVALTLCMGEWSKKEFAEFRKAGADRYLLRIETSDPILYRRLHPDSTWETRNQCLQDLRELGFQVGSGILVGLPGQDAESLRKDLKYLKALRPEMVGIGPFIPHPDTPLGKHPGGTLKDCLTFLALLRLHLPDVFLPATTAMGSIDPQGRQKALKAGANVLMPNVSPMENREKYELYPAKICLADDASTCRGCVERMVTSLGRKINLGHGHISRKVF